MEVDCWTATTRAVGLGNILPLAQATRTTVTAKAGLFVVAFSKPMVSAAKQPRHDARGCAISWHEGGYIVQACRAAHAQTTAKSIGLDAPWRGTARTAVPRLRSTHTHHFFL